jgi:DNA-binding NarL/FixJ family response regulator
MITSPTRIRVLCVDDHPIVREGIASALRDQSDMELVAQAANGREAIAEFRKVRPFRGREQYLNAGEEA